MSRWQRYHFVRPPRPLRHAGVKLDNLALVPASLLPFKEEWRALANELPTGAVLIVLPSEDGAPRRILEAVTTLLEAKGYRVTTLSAERYSRGDGCKLIGRNMEQEKQGRIDEEKRTVSCKTYLWNRNLRRFHLILGNDVIE
jgi:hypothetical protein